MGSEWRECTLGEFVRLQRGHDLTASEQRAGIVPVMGSAGHNGSHSVALAKGPGVVIGRSGGSIGRAHYSAVDYWPHNTCLYVTDFLGNHPRFAYYLLNTLNLAGYNSGSAQPSLNRNYIYGMKIFLPHRQEQERIVEVLETLDNRIDLLRQTNTTLESIAQALFKSWFIDFDPVRAKQDGREPDGMDAAIAALFPNKMIETGKEPLPTGWCIKPLLDQANLLSGGTPKTDRADYWGGNILWASAKDVSQSVGPVLVTTERTITQLGLNNSATRMIPALSTVVVARGATTGRFVLLGEAMAMNQTCYALESRTGNPIALYFQMRTQVQKLVNSAHGSVFDTITTATFNQSLCVHPPMELLRKFEETARPLMERVISGTRLIQGLTKIRNTLLPRLISGKLRLPEAQELIEDATT